MMRSVPGRVTSNMVWFVLALLLTAIADALAIPALPPATPAARPSLTDADDGPPRQGGPHGSRAGPRHSPPNSPHRGTAVLRLAATCTACHGARGRGVAATAVPRLAGQRPAYLALQLGQFALNQRNHPAVRALDADLTAQQISALSIYFSRQNPAPLNQLPKPTPAQVARARQLVRTGDAARGIAACALCHGGSDGDTAVPLLQGQPRTYLIVNLSQWRSGIRTSAQGTAMNRAAAQLNHDDMQALAAYYGDLQLSPPARQPRRQPPHP